MEKGTSSATTAAPVSYVLRGGHGSMITTLRYIRNNEGRTLSSGDESGDIVLWDVAGSRRPAHKWSTSASQGGVYTLHSNQDFSLVSQHRSGIICTWDTTSLKDSSVLSIDTQSSGFCRAGMYGSLIGCTGDDGTEIGLWDMKTGKQIEKPSSLFGTAISTGNCMEVRMIQNDENGKLYLLALYENGLICCMDVAERRWIPTSFDGTGEDTLEGNSLLTFAIRNKTVKSSEITMQLNGLKAGSSKYITPFVYNINEQSTESIPDASIEIPTIGGISQIELSPTQDIFACSGWDRRIRMFSAKTFKSLGVLTLPESVESCATLTTLSATGDISKKKDTISIRGLDICPSPDPHYRISIASCIMDNIIIHPLLFPRSST